MVEDSELLKVPAFAGLPDDQIALVHQPVKKK